MDAGQQGLLDCAVHILKVTTLEDGFSLLEGMSCRTGPLRVGRHECLALLGCDCSSLRHFYWEIFDLFEQRLVVVDANTMRKEDKAACSGDREEHPCVDGKAKDCSL